MKLIKKYKFFIVVLLLLGVFVAIFSLNTSKSKEAIKQMRKASNQEQVENIWNKYIDDINSNNGREKLIKSVKEKLATMKLSDNDIAEWHNKFRVYSDTKPALNLIIVPDLSFRINQIPNTAKYDKEIIEKIYEEFFKRAKNNKSKDKLVLEVTDQSQANGIFGDIAKGLTIDLTNRENNQRALDYLNEKEAKFKDNLNELYKTALKNTSGADYVYYFKRILPDRIKKSDINTEYINKVIILTDGYLEANNKIYTKIEDNNVWKSAVANGSHVDLLEENNLFIPNMNYTLPNTEILVLEITERDNGIGWHKEFLSAYWKKWFKGMNIQNINDNNDDFFRLHNNNTDETINIVREFLK